MFRANYLAGGSSSRLPAGTLIVNPFQDQFVSIADGDYSVRDTSVLKRAAADGTDIGVDFDVLRSAIAGVDKGMPPPSRGDIPVPPAPDFTAACTYLQCTFTDASIPGTSPIASHTWTFGDGGSPADGAAATHQFTAAGTYTVTLTVTDAKGVSAPAQKSVSVDAPVPPTAALTVSCTELSCAFADASTAGTGAITSRSWAFGDGSAIDNGPVSGVHAYALAGTYTVTVVVRDANGLSGAASTTVTVEPPESGADGRLLGQLRRFHLRVHRQQRRQRWTNRGVALGLRRRDIVGRRPVVQVRCAGQLSGRFDRDR